MIWIAAVTTSWQRCEQILPNRCQSSMRALPRLRRGPLADRLHRLQPQRARAVDHKKKDWCLQVRLQRPRDWARGLPRNVVHRSKHRQMWHVMPLSHTALFKLLLLNLLIRRHRLGETSDDRRAQLTSEHLSHSKLVSRMGCMTCIRHLRAAAQAPHFVVIACMTWTLVLVSPLISDTWCISSKRFKKLKLLICIVHLATGWL